MRRLLFSIFIKLFFSGMLVLTVSCNTRLNEEQRKQMNEARKKMEIRQVPEADLLNSGMQLGEEIADSLTDSLTAGEIAVLSANYGVAIKWYTPSAPPVEPLLMDLMHAYVYAVQQGDRVSAHIQRQGKDSVLYVKPVIVQTHHQKKLNGIWCITIPAKKIVLQMPQH